MLLAVPGAQNPKNGDSWFLLPESTGQAWRVHCPSKPGNPPRPAGWKATSVKSKSFTREWCNFWKSWFRHPPSEILPRESPLAGQFTGVIWNGWRMHA